MVAGRKIRIGVSEETDMKLRSNMKMALRKFKSERHVLIPLKTALALEIRGLVMEVNKGGTRTSGRQFPEIRMKLTKKGEKFMQTL